MTESAESGAPIILVTGASRGLGHAAAELLGGRGALIVAVARTVGGLEELDDAVTAAGGPRALLTPMDISDGEAVDRLGAALFERFGRLDAVVHAAAEGPVLAPVAAATPKDVGRVFAVNAEATFRLIRSLDPLLRSGAAPKFVYVADRKLGAPFWSAYGAAKAAGLAFVETYAREQKRVAVAAFEPEPMPTALRARSHPGEDRTKLRPVAQEAARLARFLDELPHEPTPAAN